MSCLTVQKLISAYLDQNLAGKERVGVQQHLARCRDCAARSQEYTHLRAAMRSMPVMEMPEELATRLRVMASHERMRRVNRRGFAGTLRHWAWRIQLAFENLMRPVALPFAGGVLSAFCMFGMLVPTLFFRVSAQGDVPTAFYTQPSLEEAPTGAFMNDDTVLEVMVDERGRITDYSIRYGQQGRKRLDPQISELVLFSTFQPATLFGRPTSGKALVSFGRSRIVVRG